MLQVDSRCKVIRTRIEHLRKIQRDGPCAVNVGGTTELMVDAQLIKIARHSQLPRGGNGAFQQRLCSLPVNIGGDGVRVFQYQLHAGAQRHLSRVHQQFMDQQCLSLQTAVHSDRQQRELLSANAQHGAVNPCMVQAYINGQR